MSCKCIRTTIPKIQLVWLLVMLNENSGKNSPNISVEYESEKVCSTLGCSLKFYANAKNANAFFPVHKSIYVVDENIDFWYTYAYFLYAFLIENNQSKCISKTCWKIIKLHLWTITSVFNFNEGALAFFFVKTFWTQKLNFWHFQRQCINFKLFLHILSQFFQMKIDSQVDFIHKFNRRNISKYCTLSVMVLTYLRNQPAYLLGQPFLPPHFSLSALR